ncbi:MAG: hypothetical protein ABIA93_07490 [Candidatus Woesearchaeota archaeon]
MEEESLFLDNVGDSPHMRLMQFLIEGRNFDYTMTDMLKAGVSWGTLHTLVPKLVSLGIIKKNRTIGRATLYQLDRKNDTARRLIGLYDSLIGQKAVVKSLIN